MIAAEWVPLTHEAGCPARGPEGEGEKPGKARLPSADAPARGAAERGRQDQRRSCSEAKRVAAALEPTPSLR